jgi:biuret amidohydrolase
MATEPLDGQVQAQPYHWPHDASFTRENTALVIVDMQRDCKRLRLPICVHMEAESCSVCEVGGYLDAQGYGVNLQPVQDVVKQIKRLLGAWRKYELPVYHTREGKACQW